jgi:hypothetical protein
MDEPNPTYGLPNDPTILATVGKIALRHGQLDNTLRMVIRQLADVSLEVALDGTAHQGSRELRERVRKLAKSRLGEGPALLQLDAILQRARLASDQRNDILHSVWGVADGRDFVRGKDKVFHPAPTVEELESCLKELMKLIDEIHYARFSGFLFEALDKRSA